MKTAHIILIAILTCFALLAGAQNLTLPTDATAGQTVSIPTKGSGSATLYVFGPGATLKRKIDLGQSVQIEGNQLRQAGRYMVIIEGEENTAGSLFVAPAKL